MDTQVAKKNCWICYLESENKEISFGEYLKEREKTRGAFIFPVSSVDHMIFV